MVETYACRKTTFYGSTVDVATFDNNPSFYSRRKISSAAPSLGRPLKWLMEERIWMKKKGGCPVESKEDASNIDGRAMMEPGALV
jgi:hypothetical protein